MTTASVNPGEPAPVLQSLLSLPNDYGLVCLVLLLMPSRAAFVTIYTVLAVAALGRLVVACVKWFREMLSLP